MSTLNRLQNTIIAQTKHYGLGLTQEKSNISQPKEGIGDTVSKNLVIDQSTSQQKSSMLVFRQTNNGQILNDRLSSYNPTTQLIDQSQILEAESTSKEKALKPFWREYSTEISKKLWLPKETDSQGLVSSYLNGFSNNTIQSSYVIQPVNNENHNLNYQKTLWPSSQSSALNITDEENTQMYTRKIRFYPTQEQKVLFEKCFGASRFLHNQAIDWIESHPNESYSFINLRRKNMLSDKQLKLRKNKRLRWLMDIPFDTRQLVYKQLASNMKTNFTLLKKGHIKYFSMKYKSKRSKKQTFFVNKKALKINSLQLFTLRTKKPFSVKKKTKKWLEKHLTSIQCDFSITRDGNRYYLCLPLKRPKISSDQPFESVALDPGVVTFQTLFSEEGIAGKIGDRICEELIDIGLKEDKLKRLI